jgi:hypothetical protein
MAWLASAGAAVGQEAASPAGGENAGAAKPIVTDGPKGTTAVAPTLAPQAVPQGPPSPADLAAAAAAAAEDKAREEELRAELKTLREALEAEKAEREAISAELGAEREQRAEEVVSLQEKMEKAHAAVMAALRFSGYLQADWTAVNQASTDDLNSGSGALLNDKRFMIRRARLRGTLDREYVAGVLEFDGNTVNGATARIIDAEASVKLPGETADLPLLMGTIGLFKIPFGFEVVQSDRDRLFLERSTAEHALFPGEFDLGARLAGGWRFTRYALAVQNGEPLGEKSYPGRDPNSFKDVSGRLGIDTPVTDLLWIAAGFSGLSGKGFHPGNPSTKPTLQWNDRNQNGVLDAGEIIVVPGMAAQPSRNFTRFGYGADLRLGVNTPGVGLTTLYGEVYWAKNLDRGVVPADPLGPLSRDVREFGGYAAITQEIGPYAVGVRYDYYNPDQDSADPAHPLVPTSFSYKTIAVVAAANLAPARLTLEYDRNRNNLGRDTAGNPTNLKSDTLILRGQVAF